MKCPAGWLAVLALLLVPGRPAWAQTQTPKSPSAQKPEKAQPPPLFPKHRRGFYLNNDNIEVIDATPQSPPLETDDPSVPDEGEFEINLLTGADLRAEARSVNVLTVDANYGLVLKGWGSELPTQLKLEFPVVARKESGNPYQMGLGDSKVGLKFNFYNDEQRGLRLSVYPQIEFSTAGSVDKGVAEPGQTLKLPFLIAHETKYATLVGNAGFSKVFHAHERENTIDLGFGVGRAFFRKLAIMGDLRTSSTPGFNRDRLISASAGFIYGVRKTIWYARVGHSIFSDDGHHAFLGFGMKVLFDPEHKGSAQP
jgi:hypothetical protein